MTFETTIGKSRYLTKKLDSCLRHGRWKMSPSLPYIGKIATAQVDGLEIRLARGGRSEGVPIVLTSPWPEKHPRLPRCGAGARGLRSADCGRPAGLWPIRKPLRFDGALGDGRFLRQACDAPSDRTHARGRPRCWNPRVVVRGCPQTEPVREPCGG